jgi:uncharacterized protein YuzE
MKRFFTCFAVTITVFAALSALSCTLSLSPDKSNSGGTGKVYLTMADASRSAARPDGGPENFASFKNIKVWISQGDRIIGGPLTIEPVSYPITLDIPYGAGYVARALIEVNKTSRENRSRANFYVGESNPFRMAGINLNVPVSLKAGDIMAALRYASPGWTIDGIEKASGDPAVWGGDSDRMNPPRVLNDKFGRLIVAGYSDISDTGIMGIYIYDAGGLVDSLTVDLFSVNSFTIDEFLDIAYDDVSSILYVLGYESNEKMFSFDLDTDDLGAVVPVELDFEGKLSGVRSFASYTAGSAGNSFIYAPYVPDMNSGQEASGIAVFYISGITFREYGSIPFPEPGNIKDMEVIDNTLAVLVSSGEPDYYCMMYFYDLAEDNRLIERSLPYEGVDKENGGTYSIVGYDQTGVFVYSFKDAGIDAPIEGRTFHIDFDWGGGSGAGF